MKRVILGILIILITLVISFFIAMNLGAFDKYIYTYVNNKIEDDNPRINSLYIKIDNEKVYWYKDSKSKVYYLLLPNSVNRKKINIFFESETFKDIMIINKDKKVKYVVSGDKVKLLDEDYIFRIGNDKHKKNYKVKIINSKMPGLFININGGDIAFDDINASVDHTVYYSGEASIQDGDEHNTYKVKKFLGRGNTTWTRDKKAYSLKFYDKVSLLGMKESKGYNLISNYLDGTMARNYLWLSLAKNMGINYPVEFNYVELYINNKYHGTYLLTSKVETGKNRIDIDDNYLFEIDHHDDFTFETNEGYKVRLRNPDLDIYNEKDQEKVIKEAEEYLNKIEKLIYDDKTSYSELNKYIDLESFAKYYWVIELSENYDMYTNSFFVYVKDGKLHAGPIWDMDLTLNRSYIFSRIDDYFTTNSDDNLNVKEEDPNWMNELLKREEFSYLVDKTYYKYEDEFNKLPSILNDITDKLKTSSRMNYVRWPYRNMFFVVKSRTWINGNKNYLTAVNMLKNDLNKRLDWYKAIYNNVYYTDINYVAYKDTKIVKYGKVKNKTIFVPKKVNKINIYGKNKNETVLLEEIDMNEDYVDGEIIIQNETTSFVKEYNTFKYIYSFKHKA